VQNLDIKQKNRSIKQGLFEGENKWGEVKEKGEEEKIKK
jgi:hypothetical protein